MGPVEKIMIQQALREGRPLPDKIENKPELKLGSYFYLQAFLDLDSERINGMDIGQIPHSKIRDYAKWACANEEVEYCLLHHIKVMDADHIKKIKAKQERDKPKNGKFKKPR